MTNFQYQALDADGFIVKGEISAEDVQQAIAELQARGLVVQAIRLRVPESDSIEAAGGDERRGSQRVKAERHGGQRLEQAVLRTHMGTILERGRKIVPALRAYAEEMPQGWQHRQLMSVCEVLEQGDASAATRALAELPENWIPLLSAATSSSDPAQVLDEFLTETSHSEELRQKWWLALVYPLILLCLVLVVMTVISRWVIPEFSVMYEDFGLVLPWMTRWTLGVANFLAAWGVPLVGLAVAAIVVALLMRNSNAILPRSVGDWIGRVGRAPYGRRTLVARFARFVSDLLEAGVSITDALRIAGFAVNRQKMQTAAWQLANEIESTGEFSQTFFQRPLSASVAHALSPGLPRDTRIKLLREISSAQAERVRLGLSWTVGIFEPLAIIVVGLFVGWIVVALFLPLVMLVEGLSM